LKASSDPKVGVAWILDLAKTAPDPAEFLAGIIRQNWIPEDQRPAVYEALIQGAKQKLENTFGEARGWAETELRNREFEWIEYLVDHKQTQAADRVLAEIPAEVRKSRASQVVTLETRIAAQGGTLKALLDRYSKEDAPLDSLQNAATDLKQKGEDAAARQILEFVYNRQIDSFQFSAATLLGLAEIRLEQGDTNRAVALLHRMTLVVGEPFENLADAAELLSRTGHPAEALPFLTDRVRAVPWDFGAKAQLGKLLLSNSKDQDPKDQGIAMLRAVAESNDAKYETRVTAARFLGESKATPLTTNCAELNLLSGPSPIPPSSAEKPYFYSARLAAAAQSSDAAAKIRLLQGAAAIEPENDQPKLALFDEAYRAKRYQAAVAAIYPLLSHGGIVVPAEQQEEQFENPYYSTQFLGVGAAKADTVRRATIARQLAESYSKLNNSSAAIFYFRIAAQLDPADAESKKQLNSLQAQVEHQLTNRKRQPMVTENLEQDHAVRPRLGGAQ
jgi:hypothetical protein